MEVSGNKEREFAKYRESTTKQDGFIDGGHKIIKCSGCNVPLVDVWVTQPNLKIKSVIKVKCPHCDDSSFKTSVDGGIYISGTEYTDFVDSDTDVNNDNGIFNQEIVILTKKGKVKW